jgi:hypothetical protein
MATNRAAGIALQILEELKPDTQRHMGFQVRLYPAGPGEDVVTINNPGHDLLRLIRQWEHLPRAERRP